MTKAEGYSDSKGIIAARSAILEYAKSKGFNNLAIEHIYTGNGASELIVMALQTLLNHGDEVLVPAPDYPLWTAATNLAGGKAVHYLCDEASEWNPDIRDMEKKINPRTKAIVVINPNNPTGALYARETLEKVIDLARKHKLLLFADEIYDRILYDDVEHVSLASLADDVPFVTFNGLSKSHRACGWRAGWMIVSGNKRTIADYIEGLDLMASLRLCSNVPAQMAIKAAFDTKLDMDEMTAPGGRLYEQREACLKILRDLPGVSVVKPKGAFYMFPRLDSKVYKIQDDQKFFLDFLMEHKVLLVNGRGFNWPTPDHFRIVYLPEANQLTDAMQRFSKFLATRR